MMNNNVYLNGIMGLVVGDALGCPVEFVNREELEANPVTDMGEYGTFNMPKGTWTDDSSLAMATLDALRYGYDVKRIQENFVKWLYEGKYTPAGITFGVGSTCKKAITEYAKDNSRINKCGLRDESSNGNGSLVRILPICLFVYELLSERFPLEEGVSMIHDASAITHAHQRSQIACGIYFFIVNEILSNRRRRLFENVESGIQRACSYYKSCNAEAELSYYSRLFELKRFVSLKSDKIRSSGYVVDSLEAAIWSLLNTNTYKDAVIKAVNLGHDTDTVAAITGGLAGLYYGAEEIPIEWKYAIQRREWIEKKCDEVARLDKTLLQEMMEV